MKPSEEIQVYEVEAIDDFDDAIERFFKKKNFRKLPAQMKKPTEEFKCDE